MADSFSLPNAAELIESIRKEIELIHSGKIMGCSIGTELCLVHAADAIEQLVQENAKLKAERDAAVRDLKISSDCDFCKFNTADTVFCEKSPRGDECMGKRWVWRGAQKENADA